MDAYLTAVLRHAGEALAERMRQVLASHGAPESAVSLRMEEASVSVVANASEAARAGLGSPGAAPASPLREVARHAGPALRTALSEARA